MLKFNIAALLALALVLAAPARAQYDGGPDARPHSPQAQTTRLTLIQQYVTISGQTSVTFAPIPQNYAGWEVTFFGGVTDTNTGSSGWLPFNFNGDSTSGHYKWVNGGNYPNAGFVTGTNSDSSLGCGLITNMGVAGQQAGYDEVFIPNQQALPQAGGLANSWQNTFCRAATYQGNVGIIWTIGTGVWTAAAQINSIKVSAPSGHGNFQPGSVIQLWGCSPLPCF